MKLSIRRLAAIQAADIEIDGLTVLAGPNEAGKSTIIHTLRAFFGGDPKLGLKNKGETKQLLRGDAADAVAILEQQGGEARIVWPALDITGYRIGASEIARGEARFALWQPANKAAHAVAALGAKVGGQELNDRLTKQPIAFKAEEAEAVLHALKEKGWEEMERLYREQHTKGKGAWETLAGRSYGSDIATTWRPEGWTEKMANADAAELAEAIAAAKAKLEEAVGHAAISTKAAEELKANAGKVVEAEEAVTAAEDLVAKITGELAETDAAIKALPAGLVPEDAMPCPHCGEKIVVDRSKPGQTIIRKAVTSGLEGEQLAEKRKEAAGLAGTKQRQERELQDAQRAAAAKRQQLEAAMEAKAVYEKMGAVGETTEEQASAQAYYDKLVSVMEKKKTLADAEAMQKRIVRAKDVADLLAPAGIRREKMIDRLKDFRATQLTPLAAAAGIEDLEMNDELELRRGPHSYARLSRAARYLVDAVIHTAWARVGNDPIILLDDVEALVGPRRSGLFKMLAAAQIPAVVAIAAKEVGNLDNIVKGRFGRLYWVDDGRAEEITP